MTRANMVNRAGESWRPVAFDAAPSGMGRAILAARRFFDLQTASLWADLAAELPRVRGTVIDAGCGAQPYRALFSKDAKYIGIDTADAKSHFDYEVPDTRYYEGTTWPVDDGSADFVLSTETLEHVPDPEIFLAEAARCLAPGGRILLTTPFSARWHYIPYDYWRFTPSCLDRLLRRAGFGEVAVYARGNEVTVACYKAMALMLPFVFPQRKAAVVKVALLLIGLILLPLFVALAIAGNLSLRGDGGDDCLGYTVIARRLG